MEEARENSTELSHSAHANGTEYNILVRKCQFLYRIMKYIFRLILSRCFPLNKQHFCRNVLQGILELKKINKKIVLIL
jgi:hypothetical protein